MCWILINCLFCVFGIFNVCIMIIKIFFIYNINVYNVNIWIICNLNMNLFYIICNFLFCINIKVKELCGDVYIFDLMFLR